METKMTPEKVKYLRLLAEQFPTTEALITEITRLKAQMSLPKGTEHFMSDIHGEYEAFCHIMRNCSGVIREKVHFWLGDTLSGAEADALCSLIYYPEEKLRQHHQRGETTGEWYRKQADCMLLLSRMLSSKYTREKVRRLMPKDWTFLLDELIHDQTEGKAGANVPEGNRRRYDDTIIDTLIQTGGIDGFLAAMAELIRTLAVDRLHVVGDIFDRGPRADSIMDILMSLHSVDIEWGNHDVLWMGAAAGSLCCVAGALRNSLRYQNTAILERGYGIPLRELTLFAASLYPDLPPAEAAVQAIDVIMFKLEGQLIQRNPDFDMEDRMLLHRADLAHHTIEINGKTWALKEIPFPTVDPADPYTLSPEESQIMADLRHAFTHSIRLREHVSFLYRRGWLYRTFNGNLLFHGCVPLNEDGTFLEKSFHGKVYSGKDLMDYADQMARKAFYTRDQEALDFMWYLWCGTDSPVCGRRIKTFARAYIPDREAWHEARDPYYRWYNDEKKCTEILRVFGLANEDARIINGHTPVRVTHGESPLKAGGKLVVIDGGFSRAYQKTTGIAGYTLIANSYCMRLMSHQPFTSLKDAQETDRDIMSQSFEFAEYPRRKFVADTDYGQRLQERAEDLMLLLAAFRDGTVTLQRNGIIG